MLTLTGRVTRVTKREVSAGPTWDAFTETTLQVADWGSTVYVTVAGSFDGDLPDEGQDVALRVMVKPYVTKKDNRPGYSLTALGLAEAAAPSGLRVASAG